MFKKLRNKGFSLMNGPQREKGFSLIELIVVVAIIGILVMLATPRFLGYVERAELKRIQHDVKVMEGKMEEGMVHNTDEFKSWDDNIKNLNALVAARQLFDTEGIARKVDKLSSLRFGRTASLEGVPSMVSEKVDGYRSYKVIPTSMKKNIKSSLPGTFYSNINGKVYYEHNKPLKGAEEEITLRCEAPEPIDYIFEHETGTIVKYTGNLQHLVIPSAFLVNGECWPVLIIGRGAFRRGSGNYEGPDEELPIKTVIIPPSVEIIEEEAFKGNELEEIIIPPSVEKIEKDAFKDNKIPNKKDDNDNGKEPESGGATIQKKPEEIIVDDDAFENNGPKGNENIKPEYKPPTDKDLDITIDKDGKIKDYDGDDTSIVIPPTVIVDGEEIPVTEIEEGAFQGKGLITVKMPEGLLRIEDYAFEGNQLIATIIPESVVHIGNYAFAFNELTHTKSKKTKDTIKSIVIQKGEYINTLDNEGNIASGGKKVNTIKNKTNLLDHIYVTSNNRVVVDTGGDIEQGDNKDIVSIRNKIKDIKDDIENLTKNPSNEDILSIENKINDAQSEIDKLPKGQSKDDVQKDLTSKKDQIDYIKDKKDNIDKTELEDKIIEAEKLKEGNYKSGWGNLTQAINNAKEVRDNDQAIQKDIDEVLANLKDAISKLEKVIKNKDYLFVSSGTGYQTNEGFGYYRYVGSSTIVNIPHEINGNKMHSYELMFSSQSTPVTKVISTNPNVYTFRRMFEGTKSKSLDLSQLNTSNATNMGNMFSEAYQLTSLDLSSFDTSKVFNMEGMFAYSRSLRSINLSNLDTSHVIVTRSMFQGTTSLGTINLKSFDTTRLRSSTDPGNMNGMFADTGATIGLARTAEDVILFNNTSNKPSRLTFRR